MARRHRANLLNRLPDIVMIAVLIVVLYLLNKLLPVWKRPFRLDDPDISYDFVPKDIVPWFDVAIFAILVPVGVVVLWCVAWMLLLATSRRRPAGSWLASLVDRRESKGPHWHLYTFIIAMALNVVVVLILTEVIKSQYGRLRPDFLQRCKPDLSKITPPANNYTSVRYFYDDSICKGDKADIQEGRLSFPSGHASVSFSALTLFSLWLYAILKPLPLFAIKSYNVELSTGQALRMGLAIGPVLAAAYIAISRTQQNVHNPTDVIAGAILGVAVAIWFYYIYFYTELSQAKKDMRREKKWDRLQQVIDSMDSKQNLLCPHHPEPGSSSDPRF